MDADLRPLVSYSALQAQLAAARTEIARLKAVNEELILALDRADTENRNLQGRLL